MYGAMAATGLKIATRPVKWRMSSLNVKVILLNIFAGINRCDWIATGVVQAMRDQEIKQPVVVRLSGTNYEEGQKILKESGLPFITADDLDDAARKAVEALS